MKFVAVTACTSGVAHTFMAAEALEKAAREKGYEIKVETQGTLGIENRINADEVREADAVILTNDIPIRERDRFNGKKVFNVSATACIKASPKIFEALVKQLGK